MKTGSFPKYKLILVIVFFLGAPYLHAQGNEFTISPSTVQLNFGAFVNESGGTVTLDPCSGSTTPSGNIIKIRNGSSSTFTLSSTKDKGKSFVTLTLTTVPQTLSNGIDDLSLSNLFLCIDGVQISLPDPYTYEFQVDRQIDLPLNISMGGDLNVPAGASPGPYKSQEFMISIQ